MKDNFLAQLYSAALVALSNNFEIPEFVKKLPKYQRSFKLSREIKEAIKSVAINDNYESRNNISLIAERLKENQELLELIDVKLNRVLQDSFSKNILIQVLLYRFLGPTRIQLPYSLPIHQKNEENLKSLVKGNTEAIETGFRDFSLPLLDLSKVKAMNSNLKMFMMPRGINILFGLKQYEYHSKEISIKALPGDVVLDCGGCWGDTALYFAERVGDFGSVHCFEFIISNLEILQKNLNLNPIIKHRISLAENPVWNVSKVKMDIVDNGPASKVSVSDDQTKQSKETRITISIDDYVSGKQLKSVDFIKMDIEGAEPFALQGAADTIKRYKPKLAISIYHELDHFHTIPELISSLVPEYKFYLNHYTDTEWETVLFAEVRN